MSYHLSVNSKTSISEMFCHTPEQKVLPRNKNFIENPHII